MVFEPGLAIRMGIAYPHSYYVMCLMQCVMCDYRNFVKPQFKSARVGNSVAT